MREAASPDLEDIVMDTQKAERNNPHEALARLAAGNRRYTDAAPQEIRISASTRKPLSEGQHPFAVVVCCSDSRVSPEIIFDQRWGDIFVIRNAGNIVDQTALGSIEYAVSHLGCRLVTVVGHSGCGAVNAACGNEHAPVNIAAILSHIKPATSPGRSADEIARLHAQRMTDVIRCNLSAYDIVAKPAYYDIASGLVTWF